MLRKGLLLKKGMNLKEKASAEPIVAVGAIISDIPLVDNVEKNPVEAIKTGDKVLVDAIVGSVEIL